MLKSKVNHKVFDCREALNPHDKVTQMSGKEIFMVVRNINRSKKKLKKKGMHSYKSINRSQSSTIRTHIPK